MSAGRGGGVSAGAVESRHSSMVSTSSKLNLGTFVVINAASPGRAGGTHMADVDGPGGANLDVWILDSSCAMVSTRLARCRPPAVSRSSTAPCYAPRLAGSAVHA